MAATPVIEFKGFFVAQSKVDNRFRVLANCENVPILNTAGYATSSVAKCAITKLVSAIAAGLATAPTGSIQSITAPGGEASHAIAAVMTPAIASAIRQSRNKREGRYSGKCDGKHVRKLASSCKNDTHQYHESFVACVQLPKGGL